MTDKLDCVVIGAGVVGLAVARSLALAGRDVVVVEKNARIGEETSSRNSEVIHAGIYYAEGSLKARLCVAGKELLYRYCEQKNIAFWRCGKIVVSIDDAQTPRLDALAQRAAANGVGDIEYLSASQVKALEPALTVAAGLRSPSSGIVDVHALMLALQADLEGAGGSVVPLSEFVEAEAEADGLRLRIAAGDETHAMTAQTVVNAAGLMASYVAGRIHGLATDPIPDTYYAKGNYFSYHGASPFSRLVYPIPVDGGLGIHATLDLAKRLRFGPDVEWIDSIDYAVDAGRAASFYQAIRAYWPGLADGKLSPSYAGIRPKLVRAGEAPADFAILGPYESGGAQLISLFGIESPGLTASLAIGDFVRDKLS